MISFYELVNNPEMLRDVFTASDTLGVFAMQFTGLHDRNGKDVFEGDILKNPKGEIGFVTFREGCFFLECKRKNGNTIFLTFSGGLMLNKEIIGNRFENPELL